MKYQSIEKAVFLNRPNRFVAQVRLGEETETVHVKNTGRCRELLVPGAEVLLEKSSNPNRKTSYDLVAVYKGNRLINMDSQIPNRVVMEWIAGGGLFQEKVRIRPETVYKNSRFDLYVQTDHTKAFVEVKGVTLEENGIARFPDAPTLRGIRHMEELMQCIQEGYEAYLVFVIQMDGIRLFEPNWKTHEAFGRTLQKAAAAGVHVLAYDCTVTEDDIWIQNPVPVRLERTCTGEWPEQ